VCTSGAVQCTLGDMWAVDSHRKLVVGISSEEDRVISFEALVVNFGVIPIARLVECAIHSVMVAIIMHLITMGGIAGVMVGVGVVMVGGAVATILIVGDAILIMAGVTGRMMWLWALSYWVPRSRRVSRVRPLTQL